MLKNPVKIKDFTLDSDLMNFVVAIDIFLLYEF